MREYTYALIVLCFIVGGLVALIIYMDRPTSRTHIEAMAPKIPMPEKEQKEIKAYWLNNDVVIHDIDGKKWFFPDTTGLIRECPNCGSMVVVPNHIPQKSQLGGIRFTCCGHVQLRSDLRNNETIKTTLNKFYEGKGDKS